LGGIILLRHPNSIHDFDRFLDLRRDRYSHPTTRPEKRYWWSRKF
jgi:hypothetical protein